MALSRVSALLVATTVALAPAAAFGSPARHHHHGHHHHTHATAARKHALHHRLNVDLAQTAALRRAVNHSGLSSNERKALLHQLDGLAKHLAAENRQVADAKSLRQLHRLGRSVAHGSAVIKAERASLGWLHSLKHVTAELKSANRRLDRDEARCEEENSEQMYDVDLAIDDISAAQSAIQDARHALLSADPSGKHNMGQAARKAAHDRHAAMQDLAAAAAALSDLEATFA